MTNKREKKTLNDDTYAGNTRCELTLVMEKYLKDG